MDTCTKPETSDALSQWPPKAHIFARKGPRPPKEGDLALCGTELMGIDLDNASAGAVCEDCIKIAKQELAR